MRLIRVILMVWLVYFTVGTVIGLGIALHRRHVLRREIHRLERVQIYYRSRLEALESSRYLELLGLRYGYLHPRKMFRDNVPVP